MCSHMDEPGDDHTQWSSSEKDQNQMISLACGIGWKWYKWIITLWEEHLRQRTTWHHQSWGLSWKMIQKVFFPRQKQTQCSRNQTRITKGETLGGGIHWEVGIGTYALVYTQPIKSQRPTVQNRELYPIPCENLYGKRIWKRIDVWICITESLCCTVELIATL